MAFFCMSLNLAAQNKVTLSFESEVLNSNVHVYTTLGSDPEKEVMPEEDTGTKLRGLCMEIETWRCKYGGNQRVL